MRGVWRLPMAIVVLIIASHPKYRHCEHRISNFKKGKDCAVRGNLPMARVVLIIANSLYCKIYFNTEFTKKTQRPLRQLNYR
jgi:hypothetical protein